MKLEMLLSMAVGAILSTSGIANAGTIKVGDSLNYQYTITQVYLVPPKGSPVNAKPLTWTNTSSFSVSVDRLDPDGSALATISTHSGHPPIRGWSFPDFEANVLTDGQIVSKCDEGLLKKAGIDATHMTITPGYTPQTPEEQVNFSACAFGSVFSLFDDVALGAGKRAMFKDGDAWRIVISDKNDETIDFSYAGIQSYRGHDVVILAFTTTRTLQNGPTPVKGTGYYDPQQHLLVGLHFEGDVDWVLGPEAQTIDINLQT